jgi:cytochrome c553
LTRAVARADTARERTAGTVGAAPTKEEKMLKKLFLAACLGGVPLVAGAQAPTAQETRDYAASCAICHGTNGVSSGGMPVLAGQSKETLARHMRDFRDGKRPATIMQQIAKGFTDAQIDALAGFFAAQKLK